MKSICVIFDLDGTLVDSERICNQAFLDLLPDLNEPVESLIHRYRGRQLAVILSSIECQLGVKLPADFEQQYRGRVADLFVSDLSLVPGVKEMLEAVHAPKCIASSGPPSKIRHALAVTGIETYFGSNIFSSYDVGSWKPEPGLFLHAANAMGVEPKNCVIVEDSEVGIQAAYRAGIQAFQYLSDSHAIAHPHAIPFTDMVQLPQLISRFEGQAE